MKRFLLPLVGLLAGTVLCAQTPTEDYLRRYNNLVARVGVSGVGVEPLLDKWAADWPDDTNQLLARFYFCFDRCHTSTIIQLDQSRYLGREPILPLTDSLGVVHNYFEDTEFDDALFAEAEQALDHILGLHDRQLDVHLLKISALIQYEKGSPDMALSSLKALVDRHYQEHPQWEYAGVDLVSEDFFQALIQDQCYTLFRLGTDASWEAFRSLSEQMLHYRKDAPLFLNNLGSYHFVYKKAYKKALKYYNKVLKKHPDDITAIRNCILLARTQKDLKLEKKYLPMMVQYGETETDRASAAARLEVLSRK